MRLKSAGEPSQRASQTLLFPIGGVYLKISEPISLTGSAGGRAKTKPPFRPPRLVYPTEAVRRREAEAKRQTTKEPEKMSARTLFWPEAGFSFVFKFGIIILKNELSLLHYHTIKLLKI